MVALAFALAFAFAGVGVLLAPRGAGAGRATPPQATARQTIHRERRRRAGIPAGSIGRKVSPVNGVGSTGAVTVSSLTV
jgi:hypothetical protein